MAAPVEPARVRRYIHCRYELGLPRTTSCREAGVSVAWAKKFDLGHQDSGKAYREAREEADLPGPLPVDELCPEARRALDDFGFFRMRYFGRLATPWQEEAAYKTVELLESPEKEFVVENCPPGVGKTTLHTHDIPVWLTCRNRAIRGLIGSRSARLAEVNNNRLRRSFERPFPMQAKEEEVRRGLAVDATATLARDFGRFKPVSTEMWTREQFVVAQVGDLSVVEKEPTWASFGMDSVFIGWRVDYIVWDDLVDASTAFKLEQIEAQRRWWDDVAETRLEPYGLLALVGQRLASNDLYRYCLDKLAAPDPDDDSDEWPLEGAGPELAAFVGEEAERVGVRRKYHHIVFKAHYEDRCEGRESHRRTSAAYPDGCLLDPLRLPWSELSAKQLNNPNFATVYQQEDMDPAEMLVQSIWVTGGVGVDGVEYPGCWDEQRGLCELPPVGGRLLSVVTVDPSVERNWAVEWWVVTPVGPSVRPEEQLRVLMDLWCGPMRTPDFVRREQGGFAGLAEAWQARSVDLGVPISHWVIEVNAAHKYLLQAPEFRDWRQSRSVNVVPHTTHRNKADSHLGVWQMREQWRHGRVRLPGRRRDGAGFRGLDSRMVSMFLVREATRYPFAMTDDCVMAEWFLEWNLSGLQTSLRSDPEGQWRPSWLVGSRAS